MLPGTSDPKPWAWQGVRSGTQGPLGPSRGVPSEESPEIRSPMGSPAVEVTEVQLGHDTLRASRACRIGVYWAPVGGLDDLDHNMCHVRCSRTLGC